MFLGGLDDLGARDLGDLFQRSHKRLWVAVRAHIERRVDELLALGLRQFLPWGLQMARDCR